MAENDICTLLDEWYLAAEAVKEVKPIIEREMRLRKDVFGIFFPNPKEGTNKVDLGNGYTLKGQYKLNYKVDDKVVPSVMEAIREVRADPAIYLEEKYTLDLKAYRELKEVNPEAFRILSEAITITPQSPTLEIVAPKRG